MKALKATRRRFFGLMGTGAVSAKMAADLEMSRLTGAASSGFGDASLGLPTGGACLQDQVDGGAFIPYEQRMIRAADYVRMFGLPASVDFEMRNTARHVYSLDPDIASKLSWSMAVKIMTQRQRNYERAVERIHKSGWQQRGRATVKGLLGFDWPW